MKQTEKQWTTEDARLFIIGGGEAEPTPQIVERTRRILEICEDLGLGFTCWNERLYPKLDDLLDCQVFTAVEEAFGMQISDAVYEETHARTFGDLVHFYNRQFTFISARCAHEKAKLINAPCTTQTAFYLLRRRLCDAGVSYYQAHDLAPNALNLQLTERQAAKFVDSLRYDYGLALRGQRVLWGRVRTGTVYAAYLLMLGILFGIIAYLPLGNPVLNAAIFALIWAVSGVAVGRIVNRHSQYRLYESLHKSKTLGDVARDFANAVQAQARNATS